jgi:hypothetical protein
MLKTMYQQFIEGMRAKVTDYGFTNNVYHENKRYYVYTDEERKYIMFVHINTPMAFAPSDLVTLISSNLVKIEALHFEELTD